MASAANERPVSGPQGAEPPHLAGTSGRPSTAWSRRRSSFWARPWSDSKKAFAAYIGPSSSASA